MSGSSLRKRCCPILLFMEIIVQIACTTASSVIPTFTYQPAVITDLSEGENQTVIAHMAVADSYVQQNGMFDEGPWNISFSPLHGHILDVEGSSQQIYTKDLDYNNATRFYTFNTTFTIHGKFLGKTGVRAKFVSAKWTDDASDSSSMELIGRTADTNTLDVAVKRGADSVWLTKMFVTSLVIIISLANILMGCELDLNTVYSTMRRPLGPVIGFFTQFLVMPLLAYAIAHTIFSPKGMHSFALGLFVTGCSPGGGASNFWTLLLDGNVNLSVTMTFLSTLASLVMMPLWMSLLGHEFLQGYSTGVRMRVPYSKIVSSLISLVGPLLIGIAIAKWKPTWAARGRKMLRPFVLFVLVFVVVFGCISNMYMWRLMTGSALLGGLLLPWCGFMCGCFISIALGRTPTDVTAIAIETGIQNTGIAILMLKWSFPEPDADISALIPVIVACFTPGPLLLGAAVHMAVKRLKKRNEKCTPGEEVVECKEKQNADDSSASLFEPRQEEKKFIEGNGDENKHSPCLQI